MGELHVQSQCVKWFWNNFPEERGMLHMNNNNSRSKIDGNINKSLGIVRGVSDLELTGPNGMAWFIELKTETGDQSDYQKKWQDKITARGHQYIIIRSLDQFKRLINSIYGTQVE